MSRQASIGRCVPRRDELADLLLLDDRVDHAVEVAR